MVLHNAYVKPDKAKEGRKSPVDMTRSDERSWIHRRTIDLLLAEHPDGQFPEEDWSRLYKAAKEQWADQED